MPRLKFKPFIGFTMGMMFIFGCDTETATSLSTSEDNQYIPYSPSVFDTLVSGKPLQTKLVEVANTQPAKAQIIGTPKKVASNTNKFCIESPGVKLLANPKTTAQPGYKTYDLPPKKIPTGTKRNVRFPKQVNSLPPTTSEVGTSNLQYLGVDQGLNPGFVLDIIEDKRGNLWVSTWASGVSMYNGKSFLKYDIKSGLASNYILAIFEDNEGNIWFGTDKEGVCKYDGDHFITYTQKDGLSGNTVKKIVQDGRNNLWFATNNGITKYDGTYFSNYGELQGLGGKKAKDIAVGGNNRLLITTENGFSVYDGVLFTHYTTNNNLLTSNTSVIYEDSKENIWVGTKDQGIIMFDGYTFFTFNQSHGLSGNSISTILEDSDGNIWIGTENNGVNMYNRSHFLQITRKEGLNSNTVRTIYEDDAKNIWFGTHGGLNKYNNRTFQNLVNEEELGDIIIRGICEDQFGNLWLGHSKGVSKYDGNAFYQYTTNQGLGDNFVHTILQDSKGDLWLGTTNGVTRYTNNSFIQYSTKNGLSDNTVLCIYEDEQKNIWLGTKGNGVTKFDGEKFFHLTKKQGLSSNQINAICEDKAGNIWFGTTNGGLEKWDGNNITHYSEKEGLGANTVLSLMADRAGNLWIGTESGGLNIFSNNIFHQLSETNGLSNNIIWSIIEDYENNIWIGTEKGLDRIEINDNYAFTITNYGKLDGLKATNFYPNSVCLDSDNKLWWGTGKGLSMLNLNTIEKFKPIPALNLTSLTIYDQVIDYRKLDQTIKDPDLNYEHSDLASTDLEELMFDSIIPFANMPSALEIPHSLNHITFNFCATDWTAQHKIKYAYKLKGKDKKWHFKTDNKVVYSYLPQGKYTFLLKASVDNENWTVPLAFSFKIRPPWYKTIWAYLTYLLLGLAAIITFVALRTKKLVKRQRRLEQLVKDRTKEVVQQKEIVELKNKEIIASITYAQRIQRAILPSARTVKRQLANAFIFFEPKAIVAGDFYWLEEKDDHILVAAADCTGHGVPGAMVSLVCNNTLSRTVREFQLIEPALILNKVRDIVIESFTNSAEEVKDGMDISLVSLNINTNLLKYAGANNNLYIIKPNGELIILKADRQPIGKYVQSKDFTQHEVQLEVGDTFYLFTDGFIDQFGGSHDKKFKTSGFTDLLLSIQHLSMREQKKFIQKAFSDWKGETEQVDDVCILGVRI